MKVRFICFVSISILLVLMFYSSKANAQETKEMSYSTVPVYNYTQIESLFYPVGNNDTTYVFNFWATYCGPCIKELPYFEQVRSESISKKLKIVLVSLDFKSQIESKVIPFIKKNSIQSEVILLSDPDANTWINKVNNSWSGAIPATLIVKGNKREFYEKSFTYDELKLILTKFLEL